MTELEETLAYDALCAIQENSGTMAALANADGTPKAREAYKSGVYAPCVKLQAMLGSEAMDRGKARHEKIAKEAVEVESIRPVPPPRECPACKRTGHYKTHKTNRFYCPHCWNLFGA